MQKSKFLYFDLDNFTWHKRLENKNRILLTNEEKSKLVVGFNTPPKWHYSEFYIDDSGSPDVRYVEYPEEKKIEVYRAMRESECFPIINRGNAWYDSLTQTQKDELQQWYQEWLDVTITKQIPIKPEWLK